MFHRLLPSIRTTVLAVILLLTAMPAGFAQSEEEEEAAKKRKAMELLSKALEKLVAPERNKRTELMVAVLTDIDRAANLDDEQKKEFDLAIKGAVERSLDPWRQNYQRYAESRFQSTPEDVNDAIQKLGRVNFGTQEKDAPHRQPIWDASVERILTAEQSVRYEHVLAERAAFRHEAVTRSLIFHIDEKCSLSGEQRDQLLEILGAVVEDHFDAFSEIYGHELRNLYYQLPVFLNGVTEEKIEDVLTDGQRTGWDELANEKKSMWRTIENKAEELHKLRKEHKERVEKIRLKEAENTAQPGGKQEEKAP